MLPNFGSSLKKMLFHPNTVETHSLIEELITRSLTRWERRIKVTSVEVIADPQDQNTAWVTLRYKLVASQTAEQMQLKVRLNA